MSIFVIVTSETCPACKGLKVKDKMGTSFLDKIKEWVSPYVNQTVEVHMQHNGDLEGLKSQHPSLPSIVRALPGFFIFPIDDWKNKSVKLSNTGFKGPRKEKEIKEWAKEFSNKRTENFFTHPPSSPNKGEGEKEKEVRMEAKKAPATIATAGSVSVKTISIYE